MTSDDAAQPSRLLVASNRLPAVLAADADGNWRVEPGKGGLVNAMIPVLEQRGGLWIGWPGTTAEEIGSTDVDIPAMLDALTAGNNYDLAPVVLTADERDRFYYGFSNEIIWPLFHDLQSRAHFDPGYFEAYRAVNGKFATTIQQHVQPGDFIWIHDYHLLETATLLRDRGVDNRLGFFLHIPFPPPDIFLKLPWRRELLHSMLDFDLIGFQTRRDMGNFLNCVHALAPDATMYAHGERAVVAKDGRRSIVGDFPISIDFDAFHDEAHTPAVDAVCARIRSNLPDRKLVLGVDRLDYTKGIPNRLRAFQLTLRRHPELVRKLTLIQVVVPSRVSIPEYHGLKTQIERLVGEINGEFTLPGWIPIHYLFRSLDFPELLAYYRESDIALVTPLKDGMNLVAKEYCAVKGDADEGVLILSEFAGAAVQLKDGALLVNPYDHDGVAECLHTAYHMPAAERRERMAGLRRGIREADIYDWVDRFLAAASAPVPELNDLAPVPVDLPWQRQPLWDTVDPGAGGDPPAP